jgi:hypothetical protein
MLTIDSEHTRVGEMWGLLKGCPCPLEILFFQKVLEIFTNLKRNFADR